MRSIFTDSSSPEANSSYTFDRLMFKIRATSGTRYSSRSSIALPRFLKCLSLADSLRPSIPGWRSLREARNKKRRVKWLIGAVANLIVTDVGWVEEAGKSPLNTPTFTSRCFIRRYVPASSQRLPAATLSVARRRVVGWVGRIGGRIHWLLPE